VLFYESVPPGTYAFHTYPEQIVTCYDVFGRVIGCPVHYINLVAQSGPSGFPFIDRAQAGNSPPAACHEGVAQLGATGAAGSFKEFGDMAALFSSVRFRKRSAYDSALWLAGLPV
jgi:hypothetical protein